MISKWPNEMSASKMPSTVQKIIKGTFESVKKSDGSVIEEDAKIQYEEISEKFVSGNVAYFEHTSKREIREYSQFTWYRMEMLSGTANFPGRRNYSRKR
jgi:hypothetical protein